MSTILAYIWDMLPFALAALPVVVLARVLVCRNRRRRMFHNSIYHEVGIILFVCYLAMLLSQTILPHLRLEGGQWQVVLPAAEARMNLYPFTVVWETIQAVFEEGDMDYFRINLVGNIVVFMPLGFFLPLLWRGFDRALPVAAFGFLFSLTIEIIQYPLHRGSDVDDIWLNTLGCLLGYLLYRGFKKLFPYGHRRYLRPLR